MLPQQSGNSSRLAGGKEAYSRTLCPGIRQSAGYLLRRDHRIDERNGQRRGLTRRSSRLIVRLLRLAGLLLIRRMSMIFPKTIGSGTSQDTMVFRQSSMGRSPCSLRLASGRLSAIKLIFVNLSWNFNYQGMRCRLRVGEPEERGELRPNPSIVLLAPSLGAAEGRLPRFWRQPLATWPTAAKVRSSAAELCCSRQRSKRRP